MSKKLCCVFFVFTCFVFCATAAAQNAQLLKDINTSSQSAGPQLINFGDTSNKGFAINNDRLFYFRTTPEEGKEPWVTDLTNGATLLLKDINPGPTSSSFTEMFSVGNKVVFSADDGIHGTERQLQL